MDKVFKFKGHLGGIVMRMQLEQIFKAYGSEYEFYKTEYDALTDQTIITLYNE